MTTKGADTDGSPAPSRSGTCGWRTSPRELGGFSLIDALEYVGLVGEVRPERFERTAIRWHGRLEPEAQTLSIEESQLALAALVNLPRGYETMATLRQLLRRVRPTLLPRL